MKLFISYAHVDRIICHEIVSTLKSYEVRYDENLYGSQKWWCLAPKGEILAEFIITDDPTGFEQLNTFIKTQEKVEILIERPNGLLVEFLIQHGWCVK